MRADILDRGARDEGQLGKVVQSSMRKNMATKLGDCLDLFACLRLFLWFEWFVIGLKWRIKASGRIPISMWAFREISNVDQMVGLGPLIHHRNI